MRTALAARLPLIVHSAGSVPIGEAGYAAPVEPRRARRVLGIAHTILSLGLNVVARRIRNSRYARFFALVLILNEIRGLTVVYMTAGQLLPWAS